MTTTNTTRNPGWRSIVALIGMLMLSLSAWGLEHLEHGHIAWSIFLSPQHIFSLLGAIGSVLGAWLLQSPLKSQ